MRRRDTAAPGSFESAALAVRGPARRRPARTAAGRTSCQVEGLPRPRSITRSRHVVGGGLEARARLVVLVEPQMRAPEPLVGGVAAELLRVALASSRAATRSSCEAPRALARPYDVDHVDVADARRRRGCPRPRSPCPHRSRSFRRGGCGRSSRRSPRRRRARPAAGAPPPAPSGRPSAGGRACSARSSTASQGCEVCTVSLPSAVARSRSRPSVRGPPVLPLASTTISRPCCGRWPRCPGRRWPGRAPGGR